MLNEHITALLNKELDGTLTHEERTSLESADAANTEIQIMREDLHAIRGFLASARSIEPPPSLKAGVMRRISQQPSLSRSRRPLLEWVTELFRPVQQMRIAYGFIGGLIVGALLYAVASGVLVSTDAARRDAVGTVGGANLESGSSASEPAIEENGEFLPEAREGISAATLHGNIETAHQGHVHRITLNLVSAESLLVTFSFDGATAMLQAINPTNVSPGVFESTPGVLRVRAKSLEETAFLFRTIGEEPATVHLTVSGNGVVAYSKDITLQ